MKPPTDKQLANPIWRLANLYEVKTADTGDVVPFRPRPEQQTVFRRMHCDGFNRDIILKARRLGMSTAIDLALTDDILWNGGRQNTIVDQTASDAERKLELIVRPAVQSLMKFVPGWEILTDNKGEFTVKGPKDSNPSYLFAGVRTRGGTNHKLHISEWGVIQADDPKRSEEILTGAIPSAEHGWIGVETTWKGGRGGHLYDLVKQAEEMREEYKGPNDWRVLFFPWWVDASYVSEGDIRSIPSEVSEYLAEMEITLGKQMKINPANGTAFAFTDGQKLWYSAKIREFKSFIFREFPSEIQECFKSPVEGALYAELLDKARSEGRICDYSIPRDGLVHTAWDLGAPINTVTWFFQVVGQDIRVVDHIIDDDSTPTDRVAKILAKGYPLGVHLLPHDATSKQNSGTTFQADLEKAGLRNTRIVPRCNSVWDRINATSEMFSRFVFHRSNCDRGLEALANYHFIRESSTGLVKDIPVHDWASHAADAFGTFAQGMKAGLVLATPAERVKRRGTPVVKRAGR